MAFAKTDLKKLKTIIKRKFTPEIKEYWFIRILYLFIFIAGITMYGINLQYFEDILFYPSEYHVIAGVPFFFLAMYYNWNQFKEIFVDRDSWKIAFCTPPFLLLYFYFAYICSGIFSTPISFYITESSKNKPVETYHCSIDSVLKTYSKRGKCKAYFNFKNQTISRNISLEKAKELKESKTYKKYYVQLEVRKGPFETYVVQDWQLRLKPIL